MRATPALLLASLALVALAPTTQAADVGIEVYLHELEGGTLHLLPPEINAKTGDTLTLTITNQGQGQHDLLVCGEPAKPQSTCDNVLGKTGLIPGQGSATLSILLKEPGTFDYYSTQFGEKQAGMRGTLRVTGEPLDKGAPLGAALPFAAAALAALALRRRS